MRSYEPRSHSQQQYDGHGYGKPQKRRKSFFEEIFDSPLSAAPWLDPHPIAEFRRSGHLVHPWIMVGAPRPEPVDYMREVARTSAAIKYKKHALSEMKLAPGLVVADVGCGPGTDLSDLADVVGPSGLTVGIDLDQVMLNAAAGRGRPGDGVVLVAADAHRVPLATGVVDRVRMDRSLQHVHDPRAVLAELRRVLRHRGIAVLAEPDWSTLTIDSSFDAVSDRFVEYTRHQVVRNSVVGRQVGRLGYQVGLVVTNVVAFPAVFREFATADGILGLSRNGRAAADAGFIERHELERWLVGLSSGLMLAAVTLFVTTLVVT